MSLNWTKFPLREARYVRYQPMQISRAEHHSETAHLIQEYEVEALLEPCST